MTLLENKWVLHCGSQEKKAVFIISKDWMTVYSSSDYVMEQARAIDSGFSWHVTMIAVCGCSVQRKQQRPFLLGATDEVIPDMMSVCRGLLHADVAVRNGGGMGSRSSNYRSR